MSNKLYAPEDLSTILITEITSTKISNETKNGLDVASHDVVQVKESQSSSTPLAAGATFTGTWQERIQPEMLIVLFADQDATIFADFSVDGVNIDSTLEFNYQTGVAEPPHRIVIARRYFRVRVTNISASPMTVMRLQTSVGQFGLINSPLNSTVAQDAGAIIVRSVPAEVDIAAGKYYGFSIVNKFGTRASVTTAGVPADIWEGTSNTYTGWAAAAELVQVLSDSASDAAAGTGARTIRISGLDANYNVQAETITLNGTTPASSVNTFIRVHTAQITTAGSGGVNAGNISVRQATTTTNVFLRMLAGRNQTNCSAYTVPAGFTAYLRTIHSTIRSNASNNSVDGYIWTRSFGSVFRSRRPFTVTNYSRLNDDVYGGLVFTEKSDLILRITNSSAGGGVPVSGGYDLLLIRN